MSHCLQQWHAKWAILVWNGSCSGKEGKSNATCENDGCGNGEGQVGRARVLVLEVVLPRLFEFIPTPHDTVHH